MQQIQSRNNQSEIIVRKNRKLTHRVVKCDGLRKFEMILLFCLFNTAKLMWSGKSFPFSVKAKVFHPGKGSKRKNVKRKRKKGKRKSSKKRSETN